MNSYFDYAQAILLGQNLEDKYLDVSIDWSAWKEFSLPKLPGRIGKLAFSEEKHKFPKSIRLNENDKKYSNASYIDDPLPHDRLKFYKDQLNQLSRKRFYRNFNISDELLKDFCIDSVLNHTLIQENKNNESSSFTQNNTSMG